MKKIILFWCILISLIGNAQYLASPAYLTVNSTSQINEDGSVGAVSNCQNIAISRQYTIPATNECYRDIQYFDQSGTLLAAGTKYSHDHSSFTKILFDPNDENIVYALFTERKTNSPTEIRRYTYLRRLIKSGSTVTMSSKFEVFANTNPSDFVIASNGDVLVGNVQNNGQVNVRPIRWINGTWSSFPQLLTSSIGSALKAPGTLEEPKLWPIFMDMKDNVFIIGHNNGYYNNNHSIQIRKVQYNPINATASTIYLYNINGKSLSNSGFTNPSVQTTSLFRQSIGLRQDGGIMFVSRDSQNYVTNNPVNYLNSMAASGANTVLETTNGLRTNLVVTKDNKTFFSSKNMAGIFHLNLYSSAGSLEHSYTPATQVLNSIENLAVNHSKLLATGNIDNNNQHHQLFSWKVNLNPQISGATNFCSGNPLTFTGSIASGTSSQSHLWEIQECTSSGVLIGSTPIYSQWFPGNPGSFTFPNVLNSLPCNKYYSVKLSPSNNVPCEWFEKIKIIKVNCSPTINPITSQTICSGSSVTFNVTTNTFPIKVYANGGFIGSYNSNTITLTPSNTKSYSFVVTNQFGCTASTTCTATVIPSPVTTITGPSTFTLSANLTFTGNLIAGYSYQHLWQIQKCDSNGGNLTGPEYTTQWLQSSLPQNSFPDTFTYNNSTTNMPANYLQPGYYRIKLVTLSTDSASGCWGVTYKVIQITNSLEKNSVENNKSLNPQELNASVMITPNPTVDNINFVFDKSRTGKIEIYSLEGKLVFAKEFKEINQLETNLSEYQDGVYIARITTNGTTITKKIIKE